MSRTSERSSLPSASKVAPSGRAEVVYDRGEVLELQTSLRAASGYKGVCLEGGRFHATLHGKRLGGTHETAVAAAQKKADAAARALADGEDALKDVQRQLRRLVDAVAPTLEAEARACEATRGQLAPRVDALREAAEVDAATKKRVAGLEKRLGALQAARDEAKVRVCLA